MSLPRRKAYLAGYDVFRPDGAEHGKRLKQACAEFGIEGVFPLDNELPEGLSKIQKARWIFEANIRMILESDIVIANLNDFRAVGEPDSGTCWEIGYAVGIGKLVWGYIADSRFLGERILKGPDGLCERGYQIEDFDLPVNLMLAMHTRIIPGGLRHCLKAIQLSAT